MAKNSAVPRDNPPFAQRRVVLPFGRNSGRRARRSSPPRRGRPGSCCLAPPPQRTRPTHAAAASRSGSPPHRSRSGERCGGIVAGQRGVLSIRGGEGEGRGLVCARAGGGSRWLQARVGCGRRRVAGAPGRRGSLRGPCRSPDPVDLARVNDAPPRQDARGAGGVRDALETVRLAGVGPLHHCVGHREPAGDALPLAAGGVERRICGREGPRACEAARSGGGGAEGAGGADAPTGGREGARGPACTWPIGV